MINDTFITDDELDDFLNEEVLAGYDILIESAGPDYYMDFTGIHTTVAGTDEYVIYLLPSSIAAAIYKIVRVEVSLNGASGDYRRIRPYQFWEASDLVDDTTGWTTQERIFYRTYQHELEGAQVQPGSTYERTIRFMPVPQGSAHFRVVFIPWPGTVTGADTNDIIGINGFNDFIISGAAAKALEKGEHWAAADRQLARQERAADRIRRHAQLLNYDEQERVRDNQSSFGDGIDELWPDLRVR